MRIMCVAVVLIVYISDRQELGLHAGSGVEQKENGEGRARKKVFHDKNIHYHQGTALPFLLFRTVADGKTRLPNNHLNDINIVKMFTGKIRAKNILGNKLANTHKSWSNSTGDAFGKRLDNNSKSHDSTDRKAGATVPADFKISELNNKGRTVAIRTTEIHKNRQTRIKKWRQRRRRSRRSRPKRSRENIRRSSSRTTAEALPQVTFASPSIRSREGVTAQTDDLTGRQWVFDSGSTSTAKPARSSDSFLTKQTTFKKVSFLILITFPPGVLLGYLAIAIIFVLRHRRCLCCLEGCEGACNKLLHLERRPRHNQLPRLSQVQISARHVYVPRHKPSMAYIEDRNMLVSQFEEDRKEFQRTGNDPQVDPDVLQEFKDSPSMTRKEWLRKRLQWWLGNDRRRALTGFHADPNGPPEEFTPQVMAWKDLNRKHHHHHGVKKSSSDFTSVSMARTSSSTQERTEAKKEEVEESDVSSVDSTSYESEVSEEGRSDTGE